MNDAATMRSTTPFEAGMATSHLGFAQPVPDSGYRWWYVDGFSECGRFGVTVIAFIGSVFSPYYFRARQRGKVSATDHVSLNVILYGPEKSRWCMTERGSGALTQQSDHLVIGPSDIAVTDKGLTITIQERDHPLGPACQRRDLGRVRAHSAGVFSARQCAVPLVVAHRATVEYTSRHGATLAILARLGLCGF